MRKAFAPWLTDKVRRQVRAVCSLYDYDNVLRFALHRLLSAEPLETSARQAKGFDLAHYVDDGASTSS